MKPICVVIFFEILINIDLISLVDAVLFRLFLLVLVLVVCVFQKIGLFIQVLEWGHRIVYNILLLCF